MTFFRYSRPHEGQTTRQHSSENEMRNEEQIQVQWAIFPNIKSKYKFIKTLYMYDLQKIEIKL